VYTSLKGVVHILKFDLPPGENARMLVPPPRPRPDNPRHTLADPTSPLSTSRASSTISHSKDNGPTASACPSRPSCSVNKVQRIPWRIDQDDRSDVRVKVETSGEE
jgi:hypothetical protein